MTPAQLQHIAPSANGAQWAVPLTVAAERYHIAPPRRLAAFVAQLCYESAEFTRLRENMNYTTQRITQVWPMRFRSQIEAAPYAHRPERLANRVYANRLGNGDEASGDGWRYRGGGPIQLTGRTAYRRAEDAIGMPVYAHPELIETPCVGALVAAEFWFRNGCNALADAALDDEAFDRITRRISGGLHGRDGRRRYWRAALVSLG